MIPKSEEGVWFTAETTAADFYAEVIDTARQYGYGVPIEMGDVLRDVERTGSDSAATANALLKETAEAARVWMNDRVTPIGYYMVIDSDTFEMRYFGDDFAVTRRIGGGYDIRAIEAHDFKSGLWRLSTLIKEASSAD